MSLIFFGDITNNLYVDAFLPQAEKDYKMDFHYTDDKDCAKKYEVTAPSIVAFRQHESEKVVYQGESARKAFKSWYKTLVKDGLRKLQDDNIEEFFTETSNTCVLFRDASQEQEPWALAFVEAARVHQGKSQYFYADNSNTAQSFMLEFLKAKKEDLPIILSFNSVKNVNYRMQGEASSWTVDSVGKFV